LPDQVDREVQVDVVSRCQRGRVTDGIARPLQLFRTPLFDPVKLRIQGKPSFRRSHTQRFGPRRLSVVPFPGGSHQTEVQLVRLLAMQARVARYAVPPDRCDDAVKAFLDSAREIAEMDGFDRGYVLVDSETGTAISLTLWEDHAAFESSATKAALARRRAVDAVDGEVEWVQSFDVVRRFGD
jgi:heme-degrading monooxygenase HmoA